MLPKQRGSPFSSRRETVYQQAAQSPATEGQPPPWYTHDNDRGNLFPRELIPTKKRKRDKKQRLSREGGAAS